MGAKLALERHFRQPDAAKLALERRFGRPNGAKLALERHLGRPGGAKGALERRFITCSHAQNCFVNFCLEDISPSLQPRLARRSTALSSGRRQRLVGPDSLSSEAMSDIDLEEISIVSFETAERKPEEAEVEMVEVRAVRAAERENVRGGECEGEYAAEFEEGRVEGG